MRTTAICVAVLLLAACEETKTSDPVVQGKMRVESAGSVHTEWAPTGRFTVAFQGRFAAGYGDHNRDILLLTDTQTGHQYLAVTGCGVSELWTESRRSGKTSHTVTVEE